MSKKLSCVLVDDDPDSHDVFIRLMKNSPFAELRYRFFNAEDFLRKENILNYDMCLLDIMLPGINGFVLADKISKPYIFISGFKDKIFEAIEMAGPIDVIPKPTQSKRLNAALEKAYTKIMGNYGIATEQYFELFHVAGKKGKVSIVLADICYVQTDEFDRRNKKAVFKDGEVIKLMACTFNKLSELSQKLCQVNKSEMVSLDIIDAIEYDTINLKMINGSNVPKWITLSLLFRQNLLERFHLYTTR